MDNYEGGLGMSTTSKPLRKRRSNLNRRPTVNESESPLEYHDSVSRSSTPSDHISDAPSEGNIISESIPWRKGLHPTHSTTRASFTNLSDAEKERTNFDEDGMLLEADDFNSVTEDNPADASWKSRVENSPGSDSVMGSHHSRQLGTTSDGIGAGNKFNKVKLKVGGVTHTIHTRSSFNGSSVSGTSVSKLAPSDSIYPPHKLNQGNLDSHFSGVQGELRGVPWKDFSKTGFSFGKVDSSRVNAPGKSVRKSLNHGRLSKTKSRYLSDEFYDVEDDDEDDDEIRYLQKLKSSKIASSDSTDHDEPRGKKLRKISRVMERKNDDNSLGLAEYDSSRPSKESKKSRSLRAFEDTDYMEEESVSDVEIELKNKKPIKEQVDVAEYSKTESSITTRRRAILTGRDGSTGLGAGPIQFPDGLPPAPPRKQKEQLTEVEQQLKRAEAAQRRKMQTEKAARESEAEAIRKILGQDSTRKRREEKIRKQQEELAQERNALAGIVPSSVVRWIMGPSGTIVTFPDDIGLPSIFEPKPCSYPPPREKCAGPSCTNAYKYRDSKSKLPLCSLQCYKAIH